MSARPRAIQNGKPITQNTRERFRRELYRPDAISSFFPSAPLYSLSMRNKIRCIALRCVYHTGGLVRQSVLNMCGLEFSFGGLYSKESNMKCSRGGNLFSHLLTPAACPLPPIRQSHTWGFFSLPNPITSVSDPIRSYLIYMDFVWNFRHDTVRDYNNCKTFSSYLSRPV